MTPDETAGARATVFTAERARLLGLAYRMLSSRAEAEDVLQDAWLRYQAVAEEPERPAAWLTTVTSRIALDRLRSARHKREAYVGPWLPEPVLTGGETSAGPAAAASGIGIDPADATDRAATLTLGFLVLLDTLSPEDRVVFLLADVFGVPFNDIAEAVGRSPDACRQAASRARRRLRDAGPAPSRPDEQAWHLAAGLAAAVAAGDLDGMVALLAPGVHLVSDGGANRRAARHPVVGVDRVARWLLGVMRKAPEGVSGELAEVNGAPAFVLRIDGRAEVVLTADADDTGRATVVRVVVAPEKLARFDDPPDLL